MRIISILVICLIGTATFGAKHKMTLKDDLFAYFDFEQDPFSVRIWDRSSNNNHLRWQSTAPPSGISTPPSLVEGLIGNGVQNKSPYDTLISEALSSHNSQPFTVAFWYKPLTLVSVPGGAVIFSKLEYNVRIRISTYFYIQVEFAPDLQFLSVPVPLELNQWHFITFGYYTDNGSFIWASVNMSDRLRVAMPSIGTFGDSEFIVGSSDTGGDVQGVYDEMGIWTRNVTANELRQLYNKGRGLTFDDFDEVRPCKQVECCD